MRSAFLQIVQIDPLIATSDDVTSKGVVLLEWKMTLVFNGVEIVGNQ